MTPRVALVYFEGCPHVQAARLHLSSALVQAGFPAEWTEWDQASPETPVELRGYGSPTVFVNGADVLGGFPASGLACAASGAPSIEVIVAALREGRPAAGP